MKLSTLLEAGMSRRDFMKKAGASSVLPSLIDAGITPETAQNLIGPNAPKIWVQLYADTEDSYWSASDHLAQTVDGYNQLRKMAGQDSQIMAGSGNVGGEDVYRFGAFINPDQLAKILSVSHDKEINNSKNGIDYTLITYGQGHGPNDMFDVRIKSEDSDKWTGISSRSWSPINGKDIIKHWWDEFGEWSSKVVTPQELQKFKKHGADTSDKEMEMEPQHQEPEDIEVPSDYRMASSMHQPFESKLARILGLI